MTGVDYVLETKAVFRRKDTQIETTDCVIDKVIRLSGTEFDRFSRNLLRDWDFIRDNPIVTVVDEEGRYHCLLIAGDGRRDGILVNPEGSGYARYSSFIPNAEDLLTVGQYPALAALNQKLTGIVDHIAGQAGDPVTIDLLELETRFGTDLMRNGTLLHTVLGMLDERPEIRDYELDKNELTIYRELDLTKQAGIQDGVDRASGPSDPSAPEVRLTEILPGTADESKMFYRNDAAGSLCIGYLRGDFGKSGKEFWHNWFDGKNGGNTPEFKSEFQNVINRLRSEGLYDLKTTQDFCRCHPEARLPDDVHRYGFKLETDIRQYYIRCTVLQNDYFYVFAYDKAAPMLEREQSAGERPSVLKQIRDAKQAPRPPRKDRSPGRQRGDAEL